jgi:hypothetical protein
VRYELATLDDGGVRSRCIKSSSPRGSTQGSRFVDLIAALDRYGRLIG